MKLYTLTGTDGKPYMSPVKGKLGGHQGKKIYGKLDCPSAERWLKKGHYKPFRVFFKDEPTAAAAGYRPCGVCLPEKYQLWKRRKMNMIQRENPGKPRSWLA